MSKPLKRLKIKLFYPGNKSHKVVLMNAPKGRIIPPGGEQTTLENFASQYEKNFPEDEFSLREVGRGEYNFVWIGKREADPAELLVGGMHLGEVVTVELGR